MKLVSSLKKQINNNNEGSIFMRAGLRNNKKRSSKEEAQNYSSRDIKFKTA